MWILALAVWCVASVVVSLLVARGLGAAARVAPPVSGLSRSEYSERFDVAL